MLINRVIHQTVENPQFMLPEYVENRKKMADLNPDWRLKLYFSPDREEFIRANYDSEILKAYLSIDYRYGAARADFFRYLVVYAEGGLYLDIKATALKPLNNVLRTDDKFLVARWPDRIDGVDLTAIGQHKELEFPEYQNWFILSIQKHFALQFVIEQVLRNLHDYRPFQVGVGKSGVLRTTGPIAYSKAVHEFVQSGSARLTTNDELGFRPTIHTIEDSAYPFPNMHNSKHYSELHIPIVRKSALHSTLFSLSHRLILKIKTLAHK